MTHEEQRLSQLLKRLVPEPPFQLSADQVATRSLDRSVKSWTLPALAAAAVVVIGVTTGVVATHDSGASGPTKPTTPLAAGTTSRASADTSGSPSPTPSPTASCTGQTVTVPNVIGMTQNQAVAVVQAAGLNAGIYNTTSDRVPAGTVVTQSLSAGSQAVPGAEVQLAIAIAPSTSTAAPVDPGMELTGSPTPMPPCQAVSGTPAPGASPSGSGTAVPNLIGMTAAQAVQMALAAGFSESVETTPPPHYELVKPGTVFAQTPAAGSTARGHARIVLFVAPVTR